MATILSWEQLAVNTSVFAHCPSLMPEIPISSEHFQKLKLEIKSVSKIKLDVRGNKQKLLF